MLAIIDFIPYLEDTTVVLFASDNEWLFFITTLYLVTSETNKNFKIVDFDTRNCIMDNVRNPIEYLENVDDVRKLDGYSRQFEFELKLSGIEMYTFGEQLYENWAPIVYLNEIVDTDITQNLNLHWEIMARNIYHQFKIDLNNL